MKFIKNLTAENKDIKFERANGLAEDVSAEVDALVTAKKKVLNAIKSEIRNLCDLSPNNSYSLRPGGTSFNAEDWVNKLHSAKVRERVALMEYEEAVSIKTEWFTEEVEPKTEG